MYNVLSVRIKYKLQDRKLTRKIVFVGDWPLYKFTMIINGADKMSSLNKILSGFCFKEMVYRI